MVTLSYEFDYGPTRARRKRGDQDEDLWWVNQGPLPTLASIPANTGAPLLAFSVDQAAVTVRASDSPSGQNWRGAGYMAKYEIDSQINVTGIFMNALSGVYVDPSNITLFLLDPANITTSVSYTTAPGSPIVKDSTGHYHYTFAPGKSGNWTYKWQATGSFLGTSPDTVFVVNSSDLIAG